MGLAGFADVSAAPVQEPVAPSSGPAVTLDTLSVEGRGERGDGPVRGYVARQSRAGTKTDAPIAETPQSIAVVGRQQMDDQQVRSVAEALNYSPGVFTAYRGASNVRDELFVRGFFYVPRYLDGMLLGGDMEDYAKINPVLRLERLDSSRSVFRNSTGNQPGRPRQHGEQEAAVHRSSCARRS